MAIDFKRQRVGFPALTGGPQSRDIVFVFPTNVRIAESALSGYDIGFTVDDHHLLRVRVDTLVTSISANTVTVLVSFSLRDNSGNFDDPYNGFVDVMAIVDRL